MLDRTKAPEVHTIGEISLPKPETHILDNGTEVKMIDGGSQDVNQISILWPGGCIEAPHYAVSRICAAMMREGTALRSGKEIAETLDFNGAMLRLNSDTHYTRLTLTSLNSKTIDVLPTLRDIITEAAYPDSMFQTFLEMQEQEFRLQQSKVMTLSAQALGKLIKGENNPDACIETLEQISSTRVGQVRDYYSRVVTPHSCKVYVGGRLSADVRRNILNTLASVEPRYSENDGMPLNFVSYEPQAPQRVDITKADAMQAAVCIGLPAPSRNHPDYLPLRFTIIALGGYFGSRLMKNIREDKGYTYGISSYLLGSQEGSNIVVYAQTDKKYVDLLIEEVKNEFMKLAVAPMGEEELMRLKQHIATALTENLDSPFAIMDYYRTIDTIGLPQGYFNDQVNLVRSITAEKICEMASRYLVPEQMRIAVCS